MPGIVRTSTSSWRHRATTRRITSPGAVGMAITTCRAPVSRTTASSWSSPPSTGTPRMRFCCFSGSSSRNATGSNPRWGCRCISCTTASPACPAPTTTVRLAFRGGRMCLQALTQPFSQAKAEARGAHPEKCDDRINYGQRSGKSLQRPAGMKRPVNRRAGEASSPDRQRQPQQIIHAGISPVPPVQPGGPEGGRASGLRKAADHPPECRMRQVRAAATSTRSRRAS
nr:MAG: hypothetical protein KatS3mg041_2025 [Bacteroidota bacterium]